ncbi:hypothetical protein LAZ67_12000423 [Cordylochernes scorpioides]|uniref:Uncharacterized protein n=1 Tax=Cordylochernes scorpioides TaxID=51811 RepID=A0ABY6L0I9_9ARAC|nr:hypothetical protein LAZ67_12000423 [Cordylochernes scorpioides]
MDNLPPVIHKEVDQKEQANKDLLEFQEELKKREELKQKEQVNKDLLEFRGELKFYIKLLENKSSVPNRSSNHV